MGRLLRAVGLLLVVALVAAGVSAAVYLRLRPAAIEGRGTPVSGAPAGNVAAAQRAAQSVLRIETGPTASPSPGEAVAEAQGGTGVVVDSRGFILTAQAVVAGASHVGVAIPGTGVVDAHIVGSDRVTAVTMLKVDSTGLRAIELAQPSSLGGASGVVVAGAPPASQAMLGGVAAPDISVALDDAAQPGRTRVVNDLFSLDLTQPASALGDAVVDANGRLVGLVVGNQGQAVAAAVVDLGPAISQLIDSGHVTYPSVGIDYQQLSAVAGAERGLPGGALVLGVQSGGAADDAGVKVGEIVTAVNGTTIDATHSLRSLLRDQPISQPVSLRVRDAAAASRTVPVKLVLAVP